MTYDPQLRDALTWIAEHDKTTDELRQAITDALQQYDAAALVHAEIVNDNSTTQTELRQAEQTALHKLTSDPTHHNVRTLVDLRHLIDETKRRHLYAAAAAEHAASVTRTTAQHVFSKYTDTLLHLIALERCRDANAAGVNAVPEHAQYVWRRLNFDWHPDLDQLLNLQPQFRGPHVCPQRQHVMLTWSANEHSALRSNLAWCWQQIAAGNVERVNVPLTRTEQRAGMQPGANGTCLQLTAQR